MDDGQAVPTPERIRAVAQAMDCSARLLAVPVGVLELVGALLRKRAAVTRLTGSLYVDSSVICTRLGWTTRFSMEAGLAATVATLA